MIVYRTNDNSYDFDRLALSRPQDFTLLTEERSYKSRSRPNLGWEFYYMTQWQVQGASKSLILLKYPQWRLLT